MAPNAKTFLDIADNIQKSTAPLQERSTNIQNAPMWNDSPDDLIKPLKRKLDEPIVICRDDDDDDLYDAATSEWDADKIRKMIQNHLHINNMTAKKFQDTLPITSSGYTSFMKQKGPDKGIYSDTYRKAAYYFKTLEISGMPLPHRKKAKTESKGTKKDGAETKKSKAKSKEEEQEKFDVSGIHLEGEESDNVPIYDTCDDMRTKINRHLRTTKISNAAFVRTLDDIRPSPTGEGISTRSLGTFLKGKGSVTGSTSPLFYAAYIYFEKLRLKQNKPKTKKRLEMEDVWSTTGMEPFDMRRGIHSRADQRPYFDNCGRLQFENANMSTGSWRRVGERL